MELTGKLKEKVEKNGNQLTDDELNKVAGGVEGLPADADGYIACCGVNDVYPGDVLPIDILYKVADSPADMFS